MEKLFGIGFQIFQDFEYVSLNISEDFAIFQEFFYIVIQVITLVNVTTFILLHIIYRNDNGFFYDNNQYCVQFMKSPTPGKY